MFKLSQDPEFNKQLNRRTDRQTVRERKQNGVHIVHIATCSRIKCHAPNLDSFKVINGFLADRRTARLADGRRANL